MTMRMLIDARHREETRVAVVNGHRIEEFDFESAERKQLKGNIYLAKVTRVEPSLQAAFIDYGGNRHGFLAFSEIHPDYYQIPKEDRDALLAEEAEHAAEEERLRGNDQDDDDLDDEDGDEPAPRADHDSDDEDEDGEPVAASTPLEGGAGDDHAVDNLREKRTNLRHRYKIQDVIRRRQVLLVQVVKEERGNKGAALTTYLSLAGRYCVLMPNTSHGGGISRKISNGADRKRLKSIMADLALPSTMGCIVRTAGLQRSRTEIKRDFDYLARLWDEIRENTLKSAAPALVYGDSDLIKRAIRDIYNRDIEEVIVEGEEGYRQARQYMKLLSPAAAKKVKLYIDTVPLFQRGGVEEQLSAMYNPVVQLKSGGYLVINPTEALVSIDINSGRSTREHNIEQTALSTNLEAANEIARQLRLRDMAGLVVIDFIDMESNGNNKKVERAMKEALKNDRARIQVGRISSFGLFEMSRQRIRTGVLEASTRTCPHCDGTGLVRTASSAGLSALRMLEDEAARGRGSQLVLRASQEAAFYVLNRKRHELAEIEDRYGVLIEICPDGQLEGARMAVESHGPPPAHPPRIPVLPPMEAEDEEDYGEEEEDIEEETPEIEEVEAREDRPRREGREERSGEGGRKRRRRRRGGRREDGEGNDADTAADQPAGEGQTTDADVLVAVDDVPLEDRDAADATHANADLDTAVHGDAGNDEDGDSRRRRGRRGRRGGRRNRQEDGGDVVQPTAATDGIDGEVGSDDMSEAGYEASAASSILADATVDQVALDDVAPATVVPAPVADLPETAAVEEAEAGEDRPRTRRRPRARRDDGTATVAQTAAPVAAPALLVAVPAEPLPSDAVALDAVPDVDADTEVAPKPRRARRRKADAVTEPVAEPAVEAPVEPVAAPAEPVEPDAPADTVADAAPKARRPRRKKADAAETADVTPEPVAEAPAPRAPRAPRTRKAAPEAEVVVVAPTPEPEAAQQADAQPQEPTSPENQEGSPRRGWWQRTFGA
ncbi:Rne/Rng family ribonuclease [Sphingomonas montana]|uniref:Rne/Rng family ribonuclease n=1 Tax=Sphingomonas montana TaxID=1843236 RepID=UPI001F0AD5C8|nr:ribonuclease E/G [Sphingomonas montana]